VALAVGLLVLLSAASSARANGVALHNGDVLAAVGSGQVKHFSSSGTLLDTLDTTTGASYTTGMCFDSSHNLYVTDFGSDISEFNSGGNLVNPTFVSSYLGSAESCTFNAAGDMFVGAPEKPQIIEYNPSGTQINSFSVATDPTSGTNGTDWVDLKADDCTLLYADEGSQIKSFNVCTNTQNPDFADGLPNPCFELRVRPNGEVIVACASEAVRLSSTGTVLQTYPVTGSSELFAMNLDPDNTTFWTGDIGNGEISHVDIATGDVLSQFNSAPNTSLAGLSIVGGIVVSVPSMTLTPSTQSQTVGSSASVTATLDVGGTPASGKTILFSVSGANSASGSGTTNGSGQATFSYTGTHTGTDTVKACYDANNNGTCDAGETTATATVTWTPGTTSGCTMDSVGSTAFNTGSQSIHVENTLSSNTTTTEHLVLRSLTGGPQFFSLASLSSGVCHDNTSHGLGSGDSFNTFTGEGTGSFGTDISHTTSGYSIHFEIGDWGDSGSTDSTTADSVNFTVTNSHGVVVWSGKGLLTSGGEEESG